MAALTETDISSIQKNWSTISSELDIDTIGRVFYTNVFSIDPSLSPLFSFTGDKDFYDTPRFKTHAKKVISTVGKAVEGLNDLGALVPVLKALGGRHVKYGIKDEHYPSIGRALVATVEQALGDRLSAEEKKSWEILFGVIADTMLAGAKEQHEKNAN